MLPAILRRMHVMIFVTLGAPYAQARPNHIKLKYEYSDPACSAVRCHMSDMTCTSLVKMAIFTFVRCRSAILATTTLNSLFKYSRPRGIIDGPYEDILLHQLDFPEMQPDFLKMIKKEAFQEKYGRGKVYEIYSPSGRKAVKRWTGVLPLEIDVAVGVVIPLPVIVDCGAPGMLYLGSGPLSSLYNMGVLKDVVDTDGMYRYRVCGKISYGPATLSDLYASEVPIKYESIYVRGDVRCNILGLEAIKVLKILTITEV